MFYITLRTCVPIYLILCKIQLLLQHQPVHVLANHVYQVM